MIIKKTIIILLSAVLISTGTVWAQENQTAEEIKLNTILSVDDCIDMALQNNPAIQSSIYNTGIFKSKIGQARSAYFPQINFDTQYFRSNPSNNNDMFDRSDNDFSLGISMNQLIYDFGRTPANVKINQINFLATKEDLKNKLREIIYLVKQYYYQALLKQKNREVIEESVKVYEYTLKQAEGLYDKGFKSKIDVLTAEVNLNNAKIDLINAKNQLNLAIASLNNTMGVPSISEYDLSGTLEYVNYTIDFDEVLKLALENRPDLKSTKLSISSAEKSKSYAKREYWPTISGNTSYGARGNFPIDQNWRIGALVSVPIFNGLLTHNKIKEAKATVLKKEADAESIRQNIYLEIKEIYLNFEEVRERIPLAELVVKQAEHRLAIAEKRYKIGVGNIIELKDAELELRNARLSYYNALYDYNLTIFNLEKAVGKDIPDLATNF